MKLISASVVAIALLAGCAGLQTAAMPDAPTRTADGTLVGPNGMSLYTFAKDPASSGKSACNGGCAANWPPLTAPEAASAKGAYTVITRDDSKKQWAYKGAPLYYWSKDMKAGDRTGDGVAGNWMLARP